MSETSMTTVYHRVARGESWEEAARPGWQPLWMYRIEREEGRPLREVLEESAAMAPESGYGLSHHAKEWGVKRQTLQHWCLKWGIRWPRNASPEQHEAATRVLSSTWAKALPKFERERRAEVLRGLIGRCGSVNQVARLLGVGANRVSEWKNGDRPIRGENWNGIKRLIDRPATELVRKERDVKPSANHPWRNAI